MSHINDDTSPQGSFSGRWALGDIEWGKRHIMKHLATSGKKATDM
jgi:hypothetical protein